MMRLDNNFIFSDRVFLKHWQLQNDRWLLRFEIPSALYGHGRKNLMRFYSEKTV